MILVHGCCFFETGGLFYESLTFDQSRLFYHDFITVVFHFILLVWVTAILESQD